MLKPNRPRKPKKTKLSDIQISRRITKVVFDELAININLNDLLRISHDETAKMTMYVLGSNGFDFAIRVRVTVEDVVILSKEEIKNTYKELLYLYQDQMTLYKEKMIVYNTQMAVYKEKKYFKELQC